MLVLDSKVAQKDPGKPHTGEGLFLTVEFFGHLLGSLLVIKQVIGLTHIEGKNILCNLVSVVPYTLEQKKKTNHPEDFENRYKACMEVKEETHQFNR